MPEQQRFSHITVSSDDDEVVILAGAPDASPPQGVAGWPEGIVSDRAGGSAFSASVENPVDSIESAEVEGPSVAEASAEFIEAAEAEAPPVVEPTKAEAEAEAPSAVSAVASASRDAAADSSASEAPNEVEQQLADLEAAPMPFTQKAVLACAAVLIVAFVVYQFFFA